MRFFYLRTPNTNSIIQIFIFLIYNYSRLAFCLFCALPPLVKIFTQIFFLVAAALFMLYLGQNYALSSCVTANRALMITNYTHENTGAGQNFQRTNDKCESIPKRPHLSEIVTYEDGQTVIFHSGFAQIYFPVSKMLFAFIFTSNCHDDVMITSPQQASS